jgi:RNA polymerase sigma factor (sigma-70 family)
MTPEQEKLFEEHQQFALVLAKRNCPKNADTSIPEQEALLALRHAVVRFEPGKGLFKAFAKVVIKNQLRDLARQNQRLERVSTTLDSDFSGSVCDEWEAPKDQIPDLGPSPAREAERNEIRHALKMGIGQLTPEQGRIVEAYMSGHSFAEIARQNGKTEQAVGQMFHRATNNLLPFVKSQGICGVQFMPAVSASHDSSVGPLMKASPKPKVFPLRSAMLYAALVFLIIFFCVIFLRALEVN